MSTIESHNATWYLAVSDAGLDITSSLLQLTARADVNSPPPGGTRSLPFPKIDTPPVIDGKLDEKIWKKAALADHLRIPS